MDAARMAAQSDPERNPNFRRRWSAPPLNRKRPRTVGAIPGAQNSFGNSSEAENSEGARLIQWACRLDRIADAELAFGQVAAAERLSAQAAEMRETAR